MVNLPHQNRLSAYDKPTAQKTGFVPAPKPALCCVTGQYKTCLVSNTKDWLCVYKCIYIFSWYISFRYIYTYIYIKKIYAKYMYIYTQSILVFDTMQVLYLPVLGLIQFCSFDRGCKTCLDTKLVLIPLQNWLCACSKTSFVPSLNLLHQNRLCAGS